MQLKRDSGFPENPGNCTCLKAYTNMNGRIETIIYSKPAAAYKTLAKNKKIYIFKKENVP
jgi:hypothetical protein